MIKLTLCRGCSGSGKSTLAMKIAEETGAIPIAADDFFEHNGYKFEGKYISAAHSWCLGMTAYNLFRGRSVVVHNTFVEKWTIENYVALAHSIKIPWEILEPATKWRYDAQKCFEKNAHSVPLNTIENMLKKWEKTSDIEKAFEKYRI